MNSSGRKILVLIMTAIVVGALMGGCGGSDSSGGSGSSGTGSLSGSGK